MWKTYPQKYILCRSLGRLGLGHTIYISGLTCSVGIGKRWMFWLYAIFVDVKLYITLHLPWILYRENWGKSNLTICFNSLIILPCRSFYFDSLELQWVESDVGTSFINISCLPVLLNSSCLHKLSCLSDLSAEPTGTHVCSLALNIVIHVKISPLRARIFLNK